MTTEEAYVVGSTEVTVSDRDFLRSISIDAEEDERIFPSVTEAFRFCFSLGIALNQRSPPSAPLTSIAPRQFLPEHYLEILLPLAVQEQRSLGAIASEFGCFGISVVRSKVESGDSVFELVAEVLD